MSIRSLLLAATLAIAPLGVPGAALAVEPVSSSSERPAFDVGPSDDRPEIGAPVGGWSTEVGFYADVHGPAGDVALVRRLANHAAKRIPELITALGVPPGRTVDVYVVDDEVAFHRLQPGATPDWADGTAWPRWGLIFLRAPSIRPGNAESLETVLDHELVHVLLGSAFGRRSVPHWLQEGLAQYYAGESDERALQLARGDLGGTLFSLAELTAGFPQNPLGARLAYAQSADFIGWIARTGGEEALRRMIGAMADGGDANVGIRAATGMALTEADEAWRQPIEENGWLRYLVNSDVLWSLAAVGLAVGAWRRTRRGKVKMARWEAEEKRSEEAAHAAAMRRLESATGHPVADGWVH